MISLNSLRLLACLYLALNFENLNKITNVLIMLDQKKKDTGVCGWIVPPVVNVKWFFKLLKWNELLLQVQMQCAARRQSP